MSPSRTRLVIGLSALVIIGGGALVYALARSRGSRGGSDAPAPVAVPSPVATVPSWIDGTPLPEGTPQPFAVAVVIDNAPESQPQAGLAAAPLVFEVPVEGRRTRFLAVYPITADVELPSVQNLILDTSGRIGPVRSARPYFVVLASVLGAPLVHVGGSPAALALLRSRAHVDQYFDPPFTRDRTRPAPFNVFTTLDELASFTKTRGWTRMDDRPPLWSFMTTLPPELITRDGQDVRIAFSRNESSFVVTWKYDPQTGVYTRRRGGATFRDESGTAIAAANVVVLTVQSQVLDAIGRLRIPAFEPPPASGGESVHAARATVFRGGQRIDGWWGWEDYSGSGMFDLRQTPRDANDGAAAPRAIPLASGVTWVEIVDWNYE